MSFTPGPGTTYLLTSTQPIPSGTANGVLYLNGSKVVTSGSALTFDGTNFGIGTTPGTKLDVAGSARVSGALTASYSPSHDQTYISQNGAAGAGCVMATVNYAGNAYQPIAYDASYYAWRPGGSERMRLDASGNLGIGTSSPTQKLDVRNGYIVSGTGASTDGTKILGGYYTSGHLATFGSEYANGSPVIGYGVWPSTSAAASFVSATTINVQRGAYTILGANHLWYGGDAQTVAIDSPVTTSERMRLDTFGNLGLGVTPSGWSTSNSQRAFQVGPVAALSSLDAGGGNRQVNLSNNAIDFNGVPIYLASDFATVYRQLQGTHQWHIAPSGTAGNAISFTQAMTLDASGNLGVGTTTIGARVTIGDPGTGLSFTNAASGNFNLGLLAGTGSADAYVYQRANAPLIFGTNNTERARIPAAGGMVVGTAALATTATDGFLYVPTCAGTPTGTPTTQTGTAPIVVDTTNNKLYFYSGGQWRDAGP